MSGHVSVSIDVDDCNQAHDFYTQALGCTGKKQYNDEWRVVSLDSLDIHFLKKPAGSEGAGGDLRRYDRHWTPVHLDFGVPDVRAASARVEALGGRVENQQFSEHADIAMCSDPFGNGFCLIRE